MAVRDHADHADHSEHAQRPPWSPRRRAATIVALAVLLDLVLCMGAAAVGGYELAAAQSEARGSLTHVDAMARSLHDKTAVAGAAFGLARLCWWPWRPLAGLVALAVPPARGAGAVGPLLDLAADGSTGAAHALDGAAPVLAAVTHGGQPGGDTTARLLSGLQQGRPAFVSALDDMAKAERDRAMIDGRGRPDWTRRHACCRRPPKPCARPSPRPTC